MVAVGVSVGIGVCVGVVEGLALGVGRAVWVTVAVAESTAWAVPVASAKILPAAAVIVAAMLGVLVGLVPKSGFCEPHAVSHIAARARIIKCFRRILLA